ncbi:hypothetical protein [Ramlibacter tataouinensis]|uniref:Uncharacterized protein n=1 Tax=Ramlibacter tataouinensis (strain ATCC BAA-407 / DSM 14655 / LMG 21543 / TTB310) TaxID=365046 RepID=F5Y567_RAMTT|nr:hypothetical protein [Ramlibacter tataouinensis]AEG93907.1 Conserved hypothetical protein [Ramlibacter tataouinensis TTB310]
MKTVIASLFVLAPVLAFAQAPAQAPAAGAAKPAAAKPAAKPEAKPRLARSARKAVEENTPIDDDPGIQLSEADLAVARNVYVGDIPCELGAAVKITPTKREGFFLVSTRNHRFRMHPVESRTGAIRLEDPKRGAMWLQLGNKSMLMSQKLGQRLADECQSPQQVTYAEALKKNPLPSILDAPAPAASATPAEAAPGGGAAAPSTPAR